MPIFSINLFNEWPKGLSYSLMNGLKPNPNHEFPPALAGG